LAQNQNYEPFDSALLIQKSLKHLRASLVLTHQICDQHLLLYSTGRCSFGKNHQIVGRNSQDAVDDKQLSGSTAELQRSKNGA